MAIVRKMLATTVLALSALTLVLVPPAAADDAGDEAAFLSSLNGLRTAKGLPALAPNGALTTVARTWAAAMSAVGTISHNPSLASQGPSNWARLGENVGMGMDVPSVHNAFVASPAHYRNMIDAGFDSVGIGVVRNGSGALFVTVNFMQAKAAPVAAPAPAVAAPAPAAPTPAPTRAAAPAPAPARPAPAPAAQAPAVAAAPAPAVAEPPAEPVAAPVTAAPPVAPPAVTPVLPAAARTMAVGADAGGAGSPSVALALVGAGVVLAGAAGALLARRPERRAAALARR